jgi:integrase
MTPDLPVHLERYIRLRRELGSLGATSERLLVKFSRFVEDKGVPGPITARLAVEWACSPLGHWTAAGQKRRLSAVRSFLRHLQAVIPETEVPGPGLLARPTRHRPHIYSESEIAALLAAARSLGPPGSLRPLTFSTLIGLLASCGLRASEALRLTAADVEQDHTGTVLRIRQTKFRKSRLVPVHPTTASTLMAYESARQHFGYARCERFFLTHRGLPPTYGSAARTFVGLARRTGIRGPVGQPGAHLHDLRHTFAVHRLLAWCRSGADTRARLPELAIYLGHARPEYTYWYLTATPELLGAAADRFAVYAGGAK